MKKYGQNPLCPNEIPKQPCLAVERPSHGRPVLCATCRRAYAWGARLGGMVTMPKQLWVAAVTHRGDVVHARAYSRKRQAVYGVAAYLKVEEGYDGPGTLPDICDWLAQHDDHMGVDIFPASLDPADHDSHSCCAPDNAKAPKRLVIDPPLGEKDPEPLYRAVYAIDVNAPNAHQAAERAYEIMIDPQSMRPVLEIIDSRGRLTRIDLSEERAEDHE